MRIALLTPYFLPTVGGSEIYVYDLARFLDRKGHEVSVLTTNIYQGREAGLRSSEKISSICLRRFKVMGASKKPTRFFVSMYVPRENIAREVRRMDFDILHFHNLTDFTFPVALWASKKPKILTCHTIFEVVNYHYMIGPRLYFFKKILNNMQIIHALSRKDVTILARLGVDQRKIVIVPPGISVDSFYASPARAGNRLLFVGRISPEKSIETLLKALSRVNYDYELLIVGPIQDQQYFMRLRNQYSEEFKNRVKLLGTLRKDELAEVYAKADVFVFPSRMESFGLVFLEAMASKLPIISTDVGVARELIKDGENGFVVPIGDWKAIAKKIELLLSDENLRRTMGENNRKEVEKKFLADENFSKIVELYGHVRGF